MNDISDFEGYKHLVQLQTPRRPREIHQESNPPYAVCVCGGIVGIGDGMCRRCGQELNWEPAKTIKTISLWQPWASLIILGIKHYETRGWKFDHRGMLGIHATKTLVPFNRIFFDQPAEVQNRIMEAIEEAYGSYAKIPTGAVLGTVQLTGCIKTEEAIKMIDPLERACGDYHPKRYAWKLDNPRAFRIPQQCGGHQGIWNWELPA